MRSIETQSIPEGFKVTRDGNGDVEIEYATAGMRGLIIFLTVGVSAMTCGCAYTASLAYAKLLADSTSLTVFRQRMPDMNVAQYRQHMPDTSVGQT
jgi:hypothetical protein